MQIYNTNLQFAKPFDLKTNHVFRLHKLDVFNQLISKLQFLNQNLSMNQSYDIHYKSIGLDRELILKTFGLINIYFKEIINLKDSNRINPEITRKLFQGVIEYLDSQNFKKLSSRDKAIFILEIQIKIGASLEAFNTLLTSNQEKNIATSQKQAYRHVWESIQIVQQPQKAKIKQGYSFMKKIYIMTTAATVMQRDVKWVLAKKVLFGLSYPLYLMDYSTAKLKCLQAFKNPDIKLVKQIWNIPQNGLSKSFMKLTFENIAFHQKIYIPVQELPDNEFPDIYSPTKKCIKVRILNYKHLQMRGRNAKTCCDFRFFKPKKTYQKIDTIMIHMHGGGFISLSSRMTQPMTRKWAKQLKIPIFSIDYSKPPESPFPAAVNQCLAVYKFIVNKIGYYMDIEPKHIYLAGDSAGGNLACSLMGNILIHKLPRPTGIYLVYPTIDIRNKYTPSKVNSLLDPLLWPSMLVLILRQYLGGKLQLESHPLASPLLLTEAFVGGDPNDKRFPLEWPKTFISVGKKDTFYDDSLILMQKLKQSNVQCYCRVYSEFYHGYLSTIMMMGQSYFALEDSVKDLKRLIQQK